MTTPRFSLAEMAEGSAGNATAGNAEIRALEALLNGEIKNSTLSTPPGSPANGDLYLVAGSPTGAWTGQAAKLALYDNGWRFFTPKGGLRFFDANAKEDIAYSSVESAWYPVQPRWSTTEHWTGRYTGAKKIYSKVVNYGAPPASGIGSVAHGISGIDFTEHVGVETSLLASGTSNALPLPQFGTPILADYSVDIDATNINIQALGFDYSAYGAIKVRLTYAK